MPNRKQSSNQSLRTVLTTVSFCLLALGVLVLATQAKLSQFPWETASIKHVCNGFKLIDKRLVSSSQLDDCQQHAIDQVSAAPPIQWIGQIEDRADFPESAFDHRLHHILVSPNLYFRPPPFSV